MRFLFFVLFPFLLSAYDNSHLRHQNYNQIHYQNLNIASDLSEKQSFELYGRFILFNDSAIDTVVGALHVDNVLSRYIGKIESADTVYRYDDVDSVQFEGRTLYPVDSDWITGWLFKTETGIISLYQVHPSKNWKYYYQTQSMSFQEIPQVITDGELSETIASSPRLFCHYHYAPRKTIKLFNDLDSELLIQKPDNLIIAQKTDSIFNVASRHLSYQELEELIDEDSLNSLILLKKAEKLVADKRYEEAESLLKRVKRITPFNDYYLYYVKGVYFEAIQDYRKARSNYYKAIKELSYYRRSLSLSSLRKRIEKRVSKIEKTS